MGKELTDLNELISQQRQQTRRHILNPPRPHPNPQQTQKLRRPPFLPRPLLTLIKPPYKLQQCPYRRARESETKRLRVGAVERWRVFECVWGRGLGFRFGFGEREGVGGPGDSGVGEDEGVLDVCEGGDAFGAVGEVGGWECAVVTGA